MNWCLLLKVLWILNGIQALKTEKVKATSKFYPQKGGFMCWWKSPKDIIRKDKSTCRVDSILKFLSSFKSCLFIDNLSTLCTHTHTHTLPFIRELYKIDGLQKLESFGTVP